MADLNDVRRISLTLPGVDDEHGFAVCRAGKYRGFAWTWNQKVHPKRPKMPNPEVLAIRTDGLLPKDVLIASDPDKFFTEPHYDGYPAVLVHLDKIKLDELEDLLIDGWRCLAPKELVAQFDAEHNQVPLEETGLK